MPIGAELGSNLTEPEAPDPIVDHGREERTTVEAIPMEEQEAEMTNLINQIHRIGVQKGPLMTRALRILEPEVDISPSVELTKDQMQTGTKITC